MRVLLVVVGLTAMVACSPQVPNSAAEANLAAEQALRGPLAIPADGTEGVIDPGSPGISSEQDFAAVSGRETIASDAARIAENRESYQVVEPTELPTRSGEAGSSVVEYALATTNPVGQSLYNRSSFGSERRFTRNCAKYTSAELAQEDFLKRGGPQRDSRGLDPDGDGFACRWTPEPYRQARQAAAPVTETTTMPIPLVISNE